MRAANLKFLEHARSSPTSPFSSALLHLPSKVAPLRPWHGIFREALDKWLSVRLSKGDLLKLVKDEG